MTPAYGYIRIESKQQRQADEKMIRNYCTAHRLVLVAIFYERTSGHVAFKEMARIVISEDHVVRYVIVPDMTHLHDGTDKALRAITGVALLDASAPVEVTPKYRDGLT